MADEADKTADRMEVEEADVAHIRRQAEAIEPGEPGECDKCGEDMPRLVRGICCRCRDLYKLP